jgi:hypothetical protein
MHIESEACGKETFRWVLSLINERVKGVGIREIRLVMIRGCSRSLIVHQGRYSIYLKTHIFIIRPQINSAYTGSIYMPRAQPVSQ